MKKFLSVLLIVSMMFSLCIMSSAEGETVEYDIWVEDTRVTSANENDVLGDAKVKYNPVTDTLTLTDATVNEYHSFGVSAAAIYSETDFNIELIGKNTISVSLENAPHQTQNYGICSEKAITLFGGGELTVNAPSYGIYAYTGLKIDGCTVTSTASIFSIFSVDGDLDITNCNVSAFASNKNGYGIGNFYGNITIDNSDIFAVSNFGMVAQKGGKILITDSRVVCVGNNKAIYFIENCLTLRTSYNSKMYIRSSADRLGLVGARIMSDQYGLLANKYSRCVYIDLRSSSLFENYYAMFMSQIRIFKALV